MTRPHPLRALAISVSLLLLPLAACGADVTKDSLVGTWGGDFEASWALSKAGFLADTMRGADAYPDDPAEKERMVREEMKPLIEGLRHTYTADGKLSKAMMGQTAEGDYEVTTAAPPRFTVQENAGRKMTVTIEFDSASSLRWIPEKGPTLVLTRK